MKENVIVSLADANYFELLNELIDSIRQFNQAQDISICILDAGLTEDQKNIITDLWKESNLVNLLMPLTINIQFKNKDLTDLDNLKNILNKYQDYYKLIYNE